MKELVERGGDEAVQEGFPVHFGEFERESEREPSERYGVDEGK